ncbi:MAG: hypothetical protein U0P30_15990 [Vicinamibacterales bacterium]
MSHQVLLVTALALTLTNVSADAQDALRDRPTTVFVTFANPPAEIEGTLTSLTDQAIALVVDGHEQRFDLAEVHRIDRLGDPNSDGAWRGASILGALCFLLCGQGVNNGGEFFRAITVNAAFGALIGWQFDRDHVGRTTLFRARRQ